MTEEASELRRKRVLYRSHHSGMKENNILLGAFADRHLASLSDDDITWFEDVLLKENDIDIFNWITGKEPVPPEIDHPVMHRLIAFRLVS